MAQYTTEVRDTPDLIRYLDTATLSGTYVPMMDANSVGPLFLSPLTRPIRIFKFVNDSNTEVLVSWDGVNDHDILPPASFFLYDLTTNKSNAAGSQGQYVRSGTQFWIKGPAGVGNVYLACIG